jgi:phage-related protein
MLGQKIVLTNGFVKKTIKTPRSEIDLALKYKEDHERRNGQ